MYEMGYHNQANKIEILLVLERIVKYLFIYL